MKSNVHKSYLLWQQHISTILQHLFHSIIEIGIAHSGAVETREQIRNESQEERYILKHKLGKVHVTQRSHQHHILRDKQTLSCRNSALTGSASLHQLEIFSPK